MDFYLSFNNGAEQIRLPVTPSSFEVTQRHNNTVVNITNIGEINMIGKKGLMAISLSSFFPAQEYYFCKYKDFPKPYECVKLIQTWKDSGKPIRLVISDTAINIAVAIEAFNYSEQDGTRDVYFTLELKEYVFIKQAKPTQVMTTNGVKVTMPPTKRESKPIPKTYKTQKGDTIQSIAKKTTGSMSNANAIAKKNKINSRTNLSGKELLI